MSLSNRFGTAARKAGQAAGKNSKKLAKAAGASRKASANANRQSQKNEQADQQGQQTVPLTNVWTQSWSRLGDHVTGDPLPMTTPVGALQSIADQGTDAFNSTSVDGFSDAVGQQWDVISNDFNKIFTAPPAGTSAGMAALGTVGNIFSLFTSIEQMVTMWVGMIPFPAFPALRVFDIATAIPPRVGPILPIPILSGANTVLINGMPAGRCGDMGTSVGITPPYVTIFEVFFGSCNVWTEGSRQGRLLVDFTDHMKAGWGPCVTGSPNVLVGGFPLPSLVGLAMGAAFKKAFEKLGKVAKKLKGVGDDVGKAADNVATKVDEAAESLDDVAKKADDVAPPAKPANDPPKCTRKGCPVEALTGDCVDEFTDAQFGDVDAFAFSRHYKSSNHRKRSPVGNGFRHSLQVELRKRGRRWVFVDPAGNDQEFLVREPSEQAVHSHGFVLQRIDSSVVTVAKSGEPTRHFALRAGDRSGTLIALSSDSAKLNIEYDEQNRIGRCTVGKRTIRLGYDDLSRLRSIHQSEPGQSSPAVLAEYTFDDEGNLIEALNERSGRWRYTYHEDNRVNAIIEPLGYAFFHDYDQWGRVAHTWGEDGLLDLRLEYFPTERKTVVTYSDGVTESVHYDKSSRLHYTTDGAGGITTFARGDKGEIKLEINPAGEVFEHLYDSNGHRYAVQDQLGHLYPPNEPAQNRRNANTYSLPRRADEWLWGSLSSEVGAEDLDADDPILESWDSATRNAVAQVFEADRTRPSGVCVSPRATAPPPSGATWERTIESGERPQNELGINQAGYLAEVRDADGRVQVFSQSHFRSRGSDTRGDGGVTRYDYNVREYVSTITDPRGSKHEYTRDGKDRITKIVQDGEALAQYEYEPSGKVKAKLGPGGDLLFHWERGQAGLGLRRHFTSGGVEEYEYDAKGRITSAKSEAGNCVFAYGAAERPIADLRNDLGVVHTKTSFWKHETEYLGTYSVRCEQQPDGSRVITDPTGAAHTIDTGLSGLVAMRSSDPIHRLQQFDHHGRLCRTSLRSGADVRHTEYHYSPGGKLTKEFDSEYGETTLTYDPNGRIAEVRQRGETAQYRWDLADNLVSSPTLPDVELGKCNRLRSANGHTFGYDTRGRLTSHRLPDGKRDYRYDEMDRLVECVVDGKEWRAEYDALSRITKTEFGDEVVENYWDDFRLAARRWNDGRIRLYIYADEESLVPFLLVDYENDQADPGTGTRYHLISDASGIPTRAIDSAGNTVWSATRDAFGNLTIEPESRIQIDIRFPGHLFDQHLGVHHNRFRTYDPRLGRYLQIDPIGVVGGVNTYAYCPDPYVFVDIDGHGCDEAGDAKAASKNADDASGSNAFRGDDDPFSPVNKRGIRKSHINQAGDLEPANPKGISDGREVTLADHVLGSYRRKRKANSPFTSFTKSEGKAAAWTPDDGKVIEVDLDRLQKAIDAGDLPDVKIHHQDDILASIQELPDNNFKSRALNFAKDQDEVLIRGIIPKEFLKTNF
ncbi:MAG: RHS repeat-associated core domain-containing protein [Planctomycetota bacterium]